MKRVALYVRVSTQEQKQRGLSVDSQIKALKDYANDNEYYIVDIYNDAGISARKKYTKRPALLQLIQDCKDGKIDLILFTRLDRWFRSVADYYEVQQILDEYKIAWRAIWEDYETETSAGVFKVNIMLSVAQSEVDRTSERIKSVNKYKRAQGYYVGSAPIGYRVVGKNLIKDSEKEQGIKVMFDTYLKTFSMTQALDSAYEYGVLVTEPAFFRVIRNPTYCGETLQGYKCEPYITKEEHITIVDQLSKKCRVTKNKNRVYLFSGLCTCGYCGSRMSGKTKHRKLIDGSISEYTIYVCPETRRDLKHNNLQVTEKLIESYLLSNIEDILNRVTVDVKLRNKSKTNEREIQKLRNKLERLTVLFQEGDLDLDTYRKRRDETKVALATLMNQVVTEPKPLPESWRDIYDDLSRQGKQTFWRSCISEILITNETKSTPFVVLR